MISLKAAAALVPSHFTQRSLNDQFRWIAWTVVALVVAVTTFVLGRLYYVIALERARAVAAVVEERQLIAGGQHAKSQVPSRSQDFRITFDMYFDPADPPTIFEVEATRAMHRTATQEFTQIVGTRLLYARRVVATPQAWGVSQQLFRRPGTDAAEAVGLISVSVPLLEWGHGVGELLGPYGWLLLVTCIAGLWAAGWYLYNHVIAPIADLSRRASNASESDARSIKASSLQFTHPDSLNDVHRLDTSIKRCLRSLKVASKY